MVDKRRNSCATAFHTITSFLLFVVGGVVLGYGLYLLLKKSYQVAYEILTIVVENASGNARIRLPRIDIFLVVVGGVLVLASILALLALFRKCVGSFFRILYGILAVVVLVALVALAAGLFYLVVYISRDKFKSDAGDAWRAGVQFDQKDVCSLESSYNCRGFNSSDCASPACKLGTERTCTPAQKILCAPCNATEDHTGTGCFDEIKRSSRTEFIAIGAVSTALAAFVIIDVFVLCCL